MKDTSPRRKSPKKENPSWQAAWNHMEADREIGPRAMVQKLLRQSGMRPRKMFGQNFLVEPDILTKIINAAELTPDDTVIEVGPGLGFLTKELAAHVGKVIALEVDRDLVAILKKTMAAQENVEIFNQDVLEFDPQAHLDTTPYKVVANLPYYITSPTLRHFLEAEHKPQLMVVMVQKEVAERIVASPGELSILAISVQFYGQPRLVGLVSANAFYPQPKVDSAIIRIEVYDKPPVDVDPEKFFRVVHAGFSQARKQLHNALSRGFWLPPGKAPAIMREVGIDEKRRAQTLSLEEWARLTKALDEQGYI